MLDVDNENRGQTKLLAKDVQRFSHKDKQQLLMSKFDKLFGIDHLKSEGVLLQIFPMHDMHELKNLIAQTERSKDRGCNWLCSRFSKKFPFACRFR